MTMQTDAQDVLDRLKTAQSRPLGDPRFKSLLGLEKSTFSQSASAASGLTFYDLELGAKFLYPVLTPLRNSIPRVSGKGGDSSSVARNYCYQHDGASLRGFIGESRWRACSRNPGLYGDLQRHRR